MNFPKIGMRNIKTSTAVFLCLMIFEFLNRDDAVHACIAAIICMQNTLDDSFKKGMERVLGTIIGGIAGALVLFFIETYDHQQLIMFIIPFGIMILIEICVGLKLKQSVVICCVVYLNILITRQHEGGYILYTINRVINTTIGIMVTIFVNKYMAIPNKVKHLFKGKKKDVEQQNTEKIILEPLKDENLEDVSEPSSDIETAVKK